MNTTSAPTQTHKIAVMTEVIAAIKSLHLLEAIYGFATDAGCRIVGIADVLTGKQRDAV